MQRVIPEGTYEIDEEFVSKLLSNKIIMLFLQQTLENEEKIFDLEDIFKHDEKVIKTIDKEDLIPERVFTFNEN